MEICERTKQKDGNIYISRSFSSSPVYIYVFTYLYLCFVMAWRVFSCIIEWVEFGKEIRERERKEKFFYFQHNENYALIRRNKFQSYFQENLRGIIYYMLIF